MRTLMAFRACLLLTTALATAASHAAVAQPPLTRAEATHVLRSLRQIVTPEGIERTETIHLGGIDQFVSIRGTDRRNPVLLILHGGPGFAELPLAWWNTRALEEYFVVVEWDQRGAGKTYLLNDPKVVAPTMKPERFIADTEDMIGWLRQQLGKDKIFLLGHSWGSYIGLEVATRRPEWLYAYIGTGQATNTPESERRGWAYALAKARQTGNRQAETELLAIAPYAAPGQPVPLKAIMTERKWSDYFGGAMAYRHGQIDGDAATLSPDYTDEEVAHIYDGNGYSEGFLLSDVLNLNLSRITTLKCPLILLEGRHDRTVNSDVAHDWFQKVTAPEKKFIWFENSAHEVMSEEPGKFLLTMVNDVRPLATDAKATSP